MVAGSTDVVVKFVGDASSVTNEVDKVEKTGGKISGWAKGVGGAIAGAFAIKAIKDFVDQASALQDAAAASEQTFGSAAAAVEKFAVGAADAFGMSQRQATEAAITMGTFGKAAGLTGTELSGFSTDLVGLAGDLASFRGTSPEEAVLALGGALRGETEGIRQYGVLLDEGTIKARALSMGLVAATGDADKIASAQISATTAQNNYNKAVEKYGKDSPEAAVAAQKMELAQSKLGEATAGTVPDLTAQQKVLATQAEIFAQTGDAQGDFGRTSDSAANQQKKLKADMENTQAALGNALLPALQKILPYLQSMAEFVAQNAAIVVPFAAGLVALAIAFKIASVAAALFGASVGVAFIWVIAIVAAIAAIIAIVILVIKHWDTLAAAAAAVWKAIQVAWDAIYAATQTVWQFMQTAWDAILGAVTAAVNWIKSIVGSVFGAIVGVISTYVDTWKLIIQTAWDVIKAIVQGAIDAVLAYIRGLSRIGEIVRNAVSGVAGFFADAFNRAKDAALAPIDAIKAGIEGITDVFRRVVSGVKGIWNAGPGGFGFEIPGWVPGVGGNKFEIPELAKGGIVNRPTLALIGERGPEAVIPLSRGGNSMANSYTINVNVGPGSDPVQAGRQIVELIRAHERANGRAWRDIA